MFIPISCGAYEGIQKEKEEATRFIVLQTEGSKNLVLDVASEGIKSVKDSFFNDKGLLLVAPHHKRQAYWCVLKSGEVSLLDGSLEEIGESIAEWSPPAEKISKSMCFTDAFADEDYFVLAYFQYNASLKRNFLLYCMANVFITHFLMFLLFFANPRFIIFLIIAPPCFL